MTILVWAVSALTTFIGTCILVSMEFCSVAFKIISLSPKILFVLLGEISSAELIAAYPDLCLLLALEFLLVNRELDMRMLLCNLISVVSVYDNPILYNDRIHDPALGQNVFLKLGELVIRQLGNHIFKLGIDLKLHVFVVHRFLPSLQMIIYKLLLFHLPSTCHIACLLIQPFEELISGNNDTSGYEL